MTEVTATQWDAFLAQFPDAHILQSSAWGSLKHGFGWEPHYLINGNVGASVLFRNLPLGLKIAYIPKGPVGTDWQNLWPEVDLLCLKNRVIFLKVEPDVLASDPPIPEPFLKGFTPADTIQPRRTIYLSLEGSEEDWLGRMKQKTRYNIRLAEKKEVVVEQSTDIAVFHALMQATGARDGFTVHSAEYYQRVVDLFAPQKNGVIFQASYAGQPLGALLVMARGARSWYMYGATNDLERNRMPAYLLQWYAMRWSAQQGCKLYDLWGVPDEEEETLEGQFESRSDGLWGVYRFKRGFGGDLVRAVCGYDKVYRPLLYRLYQLYTRRGGGGNA
ncbi:MAG TPA: peptidoglycan bridge formation glycyltransferase FemA/FemB family protein [Longilinea sp.]|nr:peptidoglycan bridge formation glycyltransferase FemA/FemB family protein [Longilinea sp.]